jgi:hypothetical protein
MRARLSIRSGDEDASYTDDNGYVVPTDVEYVQCSGRVKFAEHNCYLIGDSPDVSRPSPSATAAYTKPHLSMTARI